MTHAERCVVSALMDGVLIHLRLEAVRHCRWVDQVVPEAPWILDQAFLDKYEIDYVAHDEDPYGAAGHEDVYSYVKSQGLPNTHMPCLFFLLTLVRKIHSDKKDTRRFYLRTPRTYRRGVQAAGL